MITYYKRMKLKPNPMRTQICSFHLKNRQTTRKLEVTWKGVNKDHYVHYKYLSVILNSSLTFKEHYVSLKWNLLCTRNTLLQKWVSSKWEAHTKTVRISALTLCFSVVEYAWPVWKKSTYAKQVTTFKLGFKFGFYFFEIVFLNF